MSKKRGEGDKPSILILGGVGFIGRNLLEYLLRSNLCSRIRVADKCLPVMAFMHERHEALYSHESVECVQADLNKPEHMERVFGGTTRFDFVVNLAAETRYGQDPTVYTYRCTELSKQCATRAKEMGCRRFIEVSTALLYKSQTKAPSNETGKLDAFTDQSRSKLAAEQEVLRLNGTTNSSGAVFDAVVVRVPFVYGPGDVNGLMPRVVCAAAYVEIQEKMKLLWDAHLKVNTVHVEDVARGIWHLCTVGQPTVPAGSIWNLCDQNDTDQGKLNTILGELFGIRTGFHGPIVSNFARLRLSDVVETANDKHAEPWEVLCKRHHIDKTPLSPFISRELLDHHHVFVDGTAIERTAGFRYNHRMMTLEGVRESVMTAIEAGIFPPILKGMAGNNSEKSGVAGADNEEDEK